MQQCTAIHLLEFAHHAVVVAEYHIGDVDEAESIQPQKPTKIGQRRVLIPVVYQFHQTIRKSKGPAVVRVIGWVGNLRNYPALQT